MCLSSVEYDSQKTWDATLKKLTEDQEIGDVFVAFSDASDRKEARMMFFPGPSRGVIQQAGSFKLNNAHTHPITHESR